jgi:hypothetical protein
MQISFVEPLSRAWERMRRMLFAPFELARWLVLGFSAWLAGLASSDWGTKLAGNAPDSIDEHALVPFEFGELADAITDHLVWLPLILLAVLVVAAILIALLWVSSRGKLVFLDNVVHERAAIVEPWKRLGKLGDSLFWWRLSRRSCSRWCWRFWPRSSCRRPRHRLARLCAACRSPRSCSARWRSQ